ncbi:hypothetical protein [Nonomuraea dietziae]|uniref:hypothetical protein n=1 Tax=Nonomuraea dietziae TaxID=65515 RepID=UPI003418893C
MRTRVGALVGVLQRMGIGAPVQSPVVVVVVPLLESDEFVLGTVKELGYGGLRGWALVL